MAGPSNQDTNTANNVTQVGDGYGETEDNSSPTQPAAAPETPAVDTSSAGGLSLTNILSGALGMVTKIFNVGGLSLPMINPLHSYASYNYIFTLYALNTNAMNNPGDTYYPGLPVVCRSGSGSPNARINTAIGKQEYYIDNVTIKSLWGFNGKTGNSIAQSIAFEVVEPYSMGGFILALQGAADKMGYPDQYTTAPFCLMIQYMGYAQNGTMTSVPNTTKYYSMQLQDVQMSISDSGSKYSITALAIAESAMKHSSQKLPSDISFSGKTVEEVLQSGKNSLSAVYNKRLKEIATDNGIAQPDQIAIIFPTDLSSGSNISGALPGFGPELNVLPTITTAAAGTATSVLSSLGISSNPAGGLISSGGTNQLGQSKMGYGPTREGLAVSSGAEAYDEADKTFDQSKVSKDAAASSFNMSSGSTIVNAINQILLSSEYAANVLKGQPDGEGMRAMWTIIPSIYHVDSLADFASKGEKPKLLVFKVYPYKVNADSNLPIPGAGSGSVFRSLFNQTVKRYEYLYTGKNTDIINLDIKINPTFMLVLPNDANKRAQDVSLSPDNNSKVDSFTDILPTIGGFFTSAIKGVVNRVAFIGNYAGTDQNGGGGEETEAHRNARTFFDTMMYGTALSELEMTIVGDPYWISSSGTGNYMAGETQYSNISTDMSVNPFNGEVDFYLNFRTPSDLDQNTGLANFNAGAGAQQYTGLYKVQEVTSNFKDGSFTQTIKALRRPLGPNDVGNISFNINNTISSLLGKIF
jgi:hypothetical protein